MGLDSGQTSVKKQLTDSELKSVWQDVLEVMKEDLTGPNFRTWLAPIDLVFIEDSDNEGLYTATISTPNNFVSKNLEKSYKSKIQKVLSNKSGLKIGEVLFSVGDKQKVAGRKKSARQDIKVVGGSTRGPAKKTRSTAGGASQNNPRGQSPFTKSANTIPLNTGYTFDNFIVGGSNELAYTVAQAISKEPGKRFNPLFLHGGVGLGKTHLMQAVANEIKANSPEKKIVYTSTQAYINDFLDHIRNKSSSNFSDKYNGADILVVDDIQFIAGKEKTMEEFFHTFNLLHQNNKQIILSADQPPRSIPTLPDRLRSRFEWGMTVDIQSPDFETRCAIIQSKTKSLGIDLEYEVVEFIATNIKNNVRELEGALNQILAMCQIQNIKPDLAFVKNVLRSSTETTVRFDYKKIIKTCSEHFGIEEKDILSPRRDQDIVLARQVAMYLMRTELKMSLPKIATSVGRKDHTTAMHSIAKITKGLEDDFGLKRHLSAVRQTLYEK